MVSWKPTRQNTIEMIDRIYGYIDKGPLLFIIYMNDTFMASKNFDFSLYAADTNLVRPLCTVSPSTGIRSVDGVDLISQKMNDELSIIQKGLTTKIIESQILLFHYRI